NEHLTVDRRRGVRVPLLVQRDRRFEPLRKPGAGACGRSVAVLVALAAAAWAGIVAPRRRGERLVARGERKASFRFAVVRSFFENATKDRACWPPLTECDAITTETHQL